MREPRVFKKDPRKIFMEMPKDPIQAMVKIRWAAERGFILCQKDGRPWPKYPRTCRHGHVIASTADEAWRKRKGGGIQRYCRKCRNASVLRQHYANREQRLAYKREYNARTAPERRAYARRWYQEHREAEKAKARERSTARRAAA